LAGGIAARRHITRANRLRKCREPCIDTALPAPLEVRAGCCAVVAVASCAIRELVINDADNRRATVNQFGEFGIAVWMKPVIAAVKNQNSIVSM